MNKGSLSTVFLVVLIDLIGFGIILPLMPFYASVFSASALQIGLLYSIYSAAQLVFSPIWGSISDRVGRRPIMLISTFGASIAYLIFGFADALWILFFSRLLAGVMGGNISTALAYITDVTPPEKRAQGMGLIGAAFGIGFVLGPALSSALLHPSFPSLLTSLEFTGLVELVQARSYEVPAFIAAFLSFVSFMMVLFKLPESLNVNKEQTHSKRPSIFSKALWSTFTQEGNSGVKGLLGILVFGMFVLSFGHAGLYSAFPLFCDEVMGMTADQVGIQFSVLGLIAIVIQGGLIRPLTKIFEEKHIFIVGNVIMFLGMVTMGLASSITILTIGLAGMAIGNSLNSPTLNSLVSQEVDSKNVGASLGISQSMAGLGRVVGPTWGGFLFSFQPYLPFWATSIVLFLLILFTMRLWNVKFGAIVAE